MEKFEIESCVKWIEENNLNTIALQLPDDDLDKVQDLIDILKSSIHNRDIEIFLVGDGCSPCCNDLLNAQYCHAQGLIHFGHSCLASSFDDVQQQTILILYIFYQQSLPNDAVDFLSTNHDKSHCLVFYDPCFSNAIQAYSTASSYFVFSKISSQKSIDPLHFSLYGRSVQLPMPLDPSNYSVVFIFNSQASLHNFTLYFYAYDFRSFPSDPAFITGNKLLSKRMYAIESVRNGSSFGLILSSNSLLNLPVTIHKLLDRVKYLFGKYNRKYYTFLMNTISITKMNNFEQNIDVYVLCSSCVECSWLSPRYKQCNIPLVSMTDVLQAFAINDENSPMNYSFDLTQMLSNTKITDENETGENEETNALVLKHPNSLAVQQRDDVGRGVDNYRPWWGLQITDNSTEEKEHKSIAELKEGKFGIASGYVDEKH